MSRIYSDLEIQIGDARQTLICYVQEGEIVGSVALMHEGRTVAEIARLYVRPENRGKLLGSGLLQECETRAIQSKCQAISLEVDSQRDKDKQREVIEWYMRRDYVCAYQHADGSIIMSKPL
jgi:ribosomal protein S18 acetylase RimI-like enzyme